AVLSNIVSNVPAVLLLKPFVPNLEDAQRAWLIIAMAATFAGNFTLVGSVANLIVAQRAKARGVEIGFWAYFRVGAPLSLMPMVIGLLLLYPAPSNFSSCGHDCERQPAANLTCGRGRFC